jgi:hypothetical protein
MEIEFKTEYYLLVLAFLAGCWALLLMWRRRNAPQKTAELVRKSPASPLAVLSFEEAMNPEAFAAEIQRYQTESLTINLGLDVLQCAIQAVSVVDHCRGVTLLCRMSEVGRRAYESGHVRLMGQNLPVLQDVHTGRAFEIMRGEPTKLLKVAELSSMVIGAAHVISGMDLAQKLGEVNRKIDKLLRLRKIDQVSKLERIYAAAKERLIEGQTADGVRELRRYREELRELRANWRRGLRQAIMDAPNPSEKPWWRRRKRVEEDMANQINSELADLAPLLCLSFLMDLCLAEASGTKELLIRQTLPDELSACRRVAAELSGKASSLTKIRGGLERSQKSLDGMCEMIGAIVGIRPGGRETLIRVG